MYTIGITAYYHDSSVCLFKDDKLLFACEEERFTGKKHDSSFPHKGIEYIFKHYNLSKDDISTVCYYENPKLRLQRKKSFFKSILTILKVWYNLKKISNTIHYTQHHFSHLSYSYLSSPFKKSAILSIDGVGENETMMYGIGDGNEITILKRQKYPHSIGLFYSAMTSFLGFRPNEGEYKLMGLSSYGNPNRYIHKMRNLISYENGKVQCNMNYFVWNRNNRIMFNEKLIQYLDGFNRLPNEKILLVHQDIAAAIQLRYEEVFFEILKEIKDVTNCENICLGGGCAYNGTANGKIIKSKLFNKVWIPPAPSDAGSAIGSCLSYLSKFFDTIRIDENPFLGPEYDDGEIINQLSNYKNLKFEKLNDNNLYTEVANLLNSGFVIGWFRDKIEFGARALGNRSILANPTLPNMKDRINSVIKKRESFRPFAPMIVFEKQGVYFDSDEYIPYMNQIVKVKNEYLNKLPSITHIDGTARVQSVTKNNSIYNLLIEFEKISGYPILLNTSFNVKDKTMVLRPVDAIETFLDTDMDYLVIQNYLIRKD